MTLSLDPQTNPLFRLYELSELPGVKMEDGPSFLAVRFALGSVPAGDADKLVQWFGELPAAMVRSLKLYFGSAEIADFTPHSAVDWFQWDTIDELITAGKFCENCAEIFQNLHSELEEYEAGGGPDSIENDSRSILNDLETCPTCKQRFAINVSLDKTLAIERFLIGDVVSAGKKISGVVWSDPAQMTSGFESFQDFLVFMAQRVDAPLGMFFFQPLTRYEGQYFKILPLRELGVEASNLEQQLAQVFDSYTTDVFTFYQMLRTDHLDEKRTALGERFSIPTSVFLDQSAELAAYPSHPVFVSGPLRSLIIYSLMAWLAVQTTEDDGLTRFKLSEKKDSPLEITLRFELDDVFENDNSIFGNENWSKIAGRLGRDMDQSAGSEYFRHCWAQSMDGLKADDFAAERFFTTLETIRQKAEEKRREPLPDIRELTPDLSLYIHLDTVNKRLQFQLGRLNPDLGLAFEPGEVQSTLDQVSVAELDQMARRTLTAILDFDPNNPAIKIPRMINLKTRGEALWDDMIPLGLKKTFIQLAQHEDLTLFVFSEDRSFPWELIKPRELVGSEIFAAGFEDDWWAMRFGIARWVPGALPPANELPITSVCCVATSSVLSSAQKEIDFFQSLKPAGVAVDLPATKAELLNLLSTKKYDLIHFACHGQFQEADPGESAILLPDRTLLHPDDLREGNIRDEIKNNRPLIFMNCCHSGRTGSTLVGVAGWTKRLIDWGCGAFIGCSWEVADPLAADFAITFYKRFRDDRKTLGQAVYHARKQIKQQTINEGASENSTWLAYCLYGNPNGMYKS